MANLGSNSTPIAGESFDLPSGWSLVENTDGEVVITDSGDNEVFRRDETNGKWVTDSFDVTIELSLPTAAEGDTAPSDSSIAIDPNTGELLTPD